MNKIDWSYTFLLYSDCSLNIRISLFYISDEVKSMWIFLKKGSFMRPENVELPAQRYVLLL